MLVNKTAMSTNAYLELKSLSLSIISIFKRKAFKIDLETCHLVSLHSMHILAGLKILSGYPGSSYHSRPLHIKKSAHHLAVAIATA